MSNSGAIRVGSRFARDLRHPCKSIATSLNGNADHSLEFETPTRKAGAVLILDIMVIGEEPISGALCMCRGREK